MTEIVKENGKSEKFDSKKLEASVRNVGRDEKTAKEISELVEARNPTSTKDIRKIVSKELRNRSVDASRTYEESRSAARTYMESRILVAKNGNKAAPGMALLPKEAMSRLNLEDGDKFMIMHGNQRQALMAKSSENPEMRWNEIGLHTDDMRNIGASDGFDIVAQKNLV
ncbi:MAG TPA: hypothetical protein ENN76_03720 [Euryarchaeota archaeon]|nr:hypothetical protein [Euryarchaeota archaeon]